MVSGGLPPSSEAETTASKVKQFSDERKLMVRFMQLAYIFTDLVPKILLEVLKHHVASSKAFQKKFGKKGWDGGQKHRVWLAEFMKTNPKVKKDDCTVVRKKPASEWDVICLSAALSVVMEPSGDPCHVQVKQQYENGETKEATGFEVDVSTSERSDWNTWGGFSINVTSGSPPKVVECVVTEAPKVTKVVAVPREKGPKQKKPKKPKYMSTEPRLVYLPLPEVQYIVKVKQLRNTLYHQSKAEVSVDKLKQNVTFVRRLIERALCPYFSKEFCDGYRAELERAACTETFRVWSINDKDLAELMQMMKGRKKRIEALCNIMSDTDPITRIVNAQHEADDLAKEFHRLYPHEMMANLCTSDKTAAYAYVLRHHPSLEKLNLLCPMTGSVNLQPLLDALSHHPTVRELYIEYGHEALCQFLRGKHRLAKVELNETPEEVVVAALSTESSTMEELWWGCDIHDGDDATDNLLDCLRNTSLRCITIGGGVGKALLPILRALAKNTKTVERIVESESYDVPFDPSSVSQFSELRQFLVPCVRCVLQVPLPVGVWGTLLSGVGDARQLGQLKVVMCGQPEGAGLEWDHIDQLTLEEVEKSWAHSRCGEVEVNISGCSYDEEMRCWRTFPVIIQGSTLDATMKLLCAVVRGIIQRKDQFVFKLEVNDEQVSRLVELEDIAKNKCAVTKTESYAEAYDAIEDDDKEYTLTVLELKPLSSGRKGKSPSSSSQPPAKRSRQRL